MLVSFFSFIQSAETYSQDNNWNFHIESTEAAMAAGFYLKAHQHSKLALSVAERSYPNDPRLALSWHKFAETSRLIGYLKEAAQYYGKAGKLFETTLGPTHPWSLRTAVGIGRLYSDLGYYHLAEKIYKRTLLITLNRPPKDNVSFALMLNDVADLRVRMEEYDEAENLLHRALKYARKSRGQNNWGEAMIMNNMAALYRDRGAYEEALNLYTEAFNLAKKYMNITHPGVAAIRNGQGVVLRHLGRYEEARAFHKIALTNILAAAGERSPELATVLFNIGLLEKTAGNLAIAEEKFLETIKIRKKIFGRNHQFVADTMDEYAAVLWDQGKYDESNLVKNEAEDIRNMVKKQLKDTVN